MPAFCGALMDNILVYVSSKLTCTIVRWESLLTIWKIFSFSRSFWDNNVKLVCNFSFFETELHRKLPERSWTTLLLEWQVSRTSDFWSYANHEGDKVGYYLKVSWAKIGENVTSCLIFAHCHLYRHSLSTVNCKRYEVRWCPAFFFKVRVAIHED